MLQGRSYQPLEIDFKGLKDNEDSPNVWDFRKKFAHRAAIRKRIEKYYYDEYFRELSKKTRWFSNQPHSYPKVDDVVMILQDSNIKLRKGFRLGIITGVKKSRDPKTNLATIHVKLVDGLSLRKTIVKPKNCPVCGPRAFCNLVTSSRNACLLEPVTDKNALETAGGSRNITSISLPNV